MKKDLGIVDAIYPMPVLMVAAYDENNVFHRGPLGWFSHVVMIFYLISILVLSLKYSYNA